MSTEFSSEPKFQVGNRVQFFNGNSTDVGRVLEVKPAGAMRYANFELGEPEYKIKGIYGTFWSMKETSIYRVLTENENAEAGVII